MSGYQISRRSLLRAGTVGAALTIGGLPRSAFAQSATRQENVRVSFDGFAAHAEPAVAANPCDPANLIAACMAGEHDDPGLIAAYASFDGGKSWSSKGALPLPAGTVVADDVTVTFTPDGRGFVAAMATSEVSRTDRGVYHWRTDDGGRSFQAPATVVSGVFVDHPTLSAETGRGGGSPARLYASWVGDDHETLGFTRSLDGGVTFETPRAIQGPADTGVSDTRSASGPNGLVCAVYGTDPAPSGGGDGGDGGDGGGKVPDDKGGGGGDRQFVVKAVTSTDGGATFTAPTVLGLSDPAISQPGGVIADGGPSVAVDPRSGALYVAFATCQPGADHADIVARASTDAGATWSAPVTATPTTGSVVYFQPQLAVDHKGRLWCSAFALADGLVDLVLFCSPPGQPSFSAPLTVTSAPFDPTPAGDGNPKHGAWWIGDYQGLAATPYGVHPLWNDTRTGQLELYTALIK